MAELEIPMTLTELGEVLRAERERCGYSIEATADYLKISVRMVRAIEAGDVSALPHAVYARGFIRAYGDLLGVDEDIVRQVCRTLKTPEEEFVPHRPVEVPPPARRRGSPVLAVVICLVLVLGGGWYFRDRLGLVDTVRTVVSSASVSDKAPEAAGTAIAPVSDGAAKAIPESSSAPTSPSISSSISPEAGNRNVAAAPVGDSTAAESHLPDPVAPAVAAPAVVSAPEVGSEAGADARKKTGSPEMSVVEPASAAVLPAAEASADAQRNGAEQKPAVSEGHTLVLEAVGKCWIEVKTGGKTRQQTLHPGQSVSFPFADLLELKLGYAPGVRIVYDGREVKAAGGTSKVRNFVFPRDAQR